VGDGRVGGEIGWLGWEGRGGEVGGGACYRECYDHVFTREH